MYISAALPMATIRRESKIKTSCKYAVSYCSVNFVTLHLVCLWHLFLLHREECSQLQGLKKKAGKENATCWVWRVESLIWTTGTKLIFLHICTLMFLCHIKYRYALFLKLRKILIQQQRSNNIGIWETKHAKLRNKLCHFY